MPLKGKLKKLKSSLTTQLSENINALFTNGKLN